MKKTLITVALLGLAMAAQAATVTLAWDPNPESDIAGYRIYWRTNTGSYATNRFVGVTSGTTGSVSNLFLGGTYRFVATAYNTSGLESEYSNEVTVALPTIPTPPQNLRTNAVILRVSLLSSESVDGLWAMVHTYEDVVFTNTMDTAFYQTKLAVAVKPAFESIGDPEPALMLPPLGPSPPLPLDVR